MSVTVFGYDMLPSGQQGLIDRMAGDLHPDDVGQAMAEAIEKAHEQGAADYRADLGLDEVCRMLHRIAKITAHSSGEVTGLVMDIAGHLEIDCEMGGDQRTEP